MKRIPFMSITASVAYAVVVATGALTVTLGLIAFVNDTSFVEYYQYMFPRFRGGATHVQIPALGYVAFVIYTGLAAAIASHTRKRIDAWQRRHTQ
jgi:hypothetical protein